MRSEEWGYSEFDILNQVSPMLSRLLPTMKSPGLVGRYSWFWPALTLGLAAAAYLFAASCLDTLTWDGGGYVFNTIQRGRPAVPCSRYSDYPLLGVVALLSQFVSDSHWLAMVQGLVIAILPMGSLILSFRFLSGPRLRPLRIWPVLGILLSALPGQIFLVAEAIPTAQIAWAMWAIIAADLSITSFIWLSGLVLYLFFLHPTAALVYAVSGGLLLLKSQACQKRAVCLRLGTALFVLAAIRLWYALVIANSYERGEQTLEKTYQTFLDARAALVFVPLVYLLAFTILMNFKSKSVWRRWMETGRSPRSGTVNRKLRTGSCELITGGNGARSTRISNSFSFWTGTAVSGVFLAYGLGWAADPSLWGSAFGYRRFVLLTTIPLLWPAILHWRRCQLNPPPSEFNDGRRTGLTGAWQMAGLAGIFLWIFAVQSLSWRSELKRFISDLDRAPKPVVTSDDLPWIAGSSLNHWASTQLSCVLQGRTVRKLFALHGTDVQRRSILLFAGTWFNERDRWFEFQLEPGGDEVFANH